MRAIGILAIAVLGVATRLAAQSPPNFIFILVDDLGWTDVGFMGSDFYETPNIDALAASGVRFTNAYAATTVCSPTRASILTGKYPARLRLTDWIHGHVRPWARLRPPDWTHRLLPAETTLAEVLANAGYDTISIGKWHLGRDRPEAHGFDINIAGDDRGQPPSYFAPYEIPSIEEGRDGEYLTDRLTDEALELIEEHRKRRFVLYLSYYTMHTPIEPKADKLAKFEAKTPGANHRNPGYASMIESLDEGVGRILGLLERLDLDDETVVIFTGDNGGLTLELSDWGPVTSNAPLREGKGSSYEGGVRVPLTIRWPNVTEPGRVADEEQNLPERQPRKVRVVQSHAVYAGMVEAMDKAVGKVLDKIDELGLADNTAVVFMSDNGGVSTSEGWPTSNLPLRGAKGWLYEGGIREPLLIRWPGVTKPGSTCSVPVISTDFYPTIAEIAGIRSAPTQDIDGESLVPLLRGDDTLDRDALYWHYPHYHPGGATPYGAIRRGDLKLIEFYEHDHVELYNLRDDPGETRDLADTQPDVAKVLRQALRRWRGDVGAQMPTPNPAFDPTRATTFTQ